MNNQPLITKAVLDDAGITVDSQEVETLLTHLNQTIEERIGTEITDSLTDDQLEHLVELQDTGDDAKVGAWLEQNVPELQEIIQDEIDILLGELSESSEDINQAR